MDTYTARDVTRDYINEIFSKPGRLDDIQIVEIPRTCEHCKFWMQNVEGRENFGECLHNDVTGDNDYVWAPYLHYVYFRKDFGCIFWEGKE
ncbi:MAG: hypothetical protein WC107_05685 [Patescibacteria group bacterium]|jgi:hypothetical protein